MSIIAAGTTTTTALSSTGNTDGTLQLQVNGTTPSVTLNTLGAVGVGASPNFGSSGQVLISGGSTTAPTWGTAGTATNATTATNLAGGAAGVVPYQTGSGATAFTAAGTTGQVLQSNGTSAPTWATPAVTAPAGTTGQVQINNAGAFGAVGSGTAGQVLTSAGAGAAPTFTTPAAGGSWVFLSEVTASGATTVDVENTFNSTYDMYVIVANNIRSGTSNNRVRIRLKVGGAYDENYSYSARQIYSDSAGSTGFAQAEDSIITSPAASISSNIAFLSSLIMYIPNPAGTSTYKYVYGEIFGINGNQQNSQSSFSGNVSSAGSAGALTGVRFLGAFGGSTLFGTFRLYGIKKS